MEELEKKALELVSILSIKPSQDGDQWCYLYGDNLQVGIAGFGNSPMKAAIDFEKEFNEELPK